MNGKALIKPKEPMPNKMRRIRKFLVFWIKSILGSTTWLLQAISHNPEPWGTLLSLLFLGMKDTRTGNYKFYNSMTGEK